MQFRIKSLLLASALVCTVPGHAQDFPLADPNTGIVVFGGYNSCTLRGSPLDMTVFKPMKDKVKAAALALNTPVRYFLGCYRTDSDKVYITHDTLGDRMMDIPLSELGNWIRHWQDNGPAMDRYALIGTSYGGWTVVHMMEEGMIPTEQVLGTYTIDPISRIDCTPRRIILNVLHFNKGYDSIGDNPCRRSPLDWQGLTIDVPDTWLNFYQQDYPILHSSPTAHASANIRIEYTVPVLKNLAHRQIQDDERVWEEIWRSLEGFEPR